MAYQLDGSNDSFDWGNQGDLSGNAVTMSIWVDIDSTAVGQEYVINLESSSNVQSTFFSCNRSNAGDIAFFRNHTGVNLLRQSTGGALSSSAGWQHILVHHDGTTVASAAHIFVDGVEVSYASSSNGSLVMNNTTGNWYVGNRSSGSRAFDGAVAEVGIWNVELDAGEIAALAAGYSPRLIRPQSLILAPPLIRSTLDPVSGDAGSTNSTPSVTGHPPIIYPKKKQIAVPVAGAPPVTGDFPYNIYYGGAF